MKLSERTLLVDLDIGVWSASKTDQSVSKMARQAHGAEDAAGRFQKNILARAALAEINRAASKCSNVHREMTLPWSKNGARIIKADAYESYVRELNVAKAAFNKAVREFTENYDALKEQAKVHLSAMFNDDDYPAIEQVKAKFFVRTEVTPVPEAGDFRVKIGNKEVQTIVRDLEKRNNDRMRVAMKEVYDRLVKLTANIAKRLKDYEPSNKSGEKGIIAQNMFEQAREIADLIPVLNITNDPVLTALGERLSKEIVGHKAYHLREDGAMRHQTAKKAAEIHKAAKEASAIYDKASMFIA
jgi:hypothetical protein